MSLDLVGPSEIAEMLAVSRRTAFRYMGRPDFPEPAARVGRTPAWIRKDVERWARKHLPLPRGRPPIKQG